MTVCRERKICSVADCGRTVKGLGLCNNHYHRLKKYGRIEKLPPRNRREHPLYMVWWERKRAGIVSTEWLNFDIFLRDVGKRPSDNHFMMRRGNEPYGPKNFQWVEHLRKRKDETGKQWYARKWAARMLANPGIERKRMFARKYGMTVEQYEDLVKSQDGKCAICEQPESSFDGKTGSLKNLCVDHCHNTGKIRGLLCFRCNATLGKLEDNPLLLRAMWDYLHEHSKIEVVTDAA